jgi:branched-chain amino acid transport system ATP-binding protein
MNILEANSVSVKYGDFQALWDISFSVKPGQLVALIGANGAGKTTTLKAICGLVPLAKGQVNYQGVLISGQPVHQVVDQGITLVPEGRQLFPKMTVEENLLVGAYLKRTQKKKYETLQRVFKLFPRLEERRTQTAETLSGGEQQMVAIGRALMQDPKVILFDEPSLGLAPILVQEVFAVVQQLHQQGLTVFIVEQNVHQTLKIANYCYVMENGRIVQEGTGKDLEADVKIREAYLGF